MGITNGFFGGMKIIKAPYVYDFYPEFFLKQGTSMGTAGK